nr:response regulator transcription factor [Rhizobium sp. Root482]
MWDGKGKSMHASSSTLEDRPIALLVDDDTNVSDAMSDLLNSVGIETISFSSAREVLEAKLPDRPSCFVLDVRMPGLSGLDLQRHLHVNGIDIPIIFLTGHGDIAMSVEAMKAGAVDFLTKPVRDQTFLDVVTKAIATDVARREVAQASRKHAVSFDSLTMRERQVLRAVVGGALNKQIAYELGISEITVKLHRSNMMKKMHVKSLTQLFAAWQFLPESVRLGDD